MTLEEKREKNRIKNRKWRKENREICNLSAAKYRKNYPNRVKEYKLKKKYGISYKEYLSLLKKQKGRCAICGNPETAIHNFTKRKQNLAVDHCHTTGQVRGLLCQDCNRGIGLLHEDVSRLRKAIKYLSL